MDKDNSEFINIVDRPRTSSKDLSPGEIFFYNWNRIAILQEQGLENLSELEKVEISMRIQLHNLGEIESIRETLLWWVIESVDRKFEFYERMGVN